jgi:hypothetical protein
MKKTLTNEICRSQVKQQAGVTISPKMWQKEMSIVLERITLSLNIFSYLGRPSRIALEDHCSW